MTKLEKMGKTTKNKADFRRKELDIQFPQILRIYQKVGKIYIPLGKIEF